MAGRVQMQGLRRLHTAMRAAGDHKAHFQLTHNGIDFDCLFLVDVTPYEFVLAAIGHPDVALLLPVQRGCFIEADFGEDYKPLARLFDQGAGTFHPFNPAQFLREIDQAMPGHYRQPTPAKIIQTYRHHVGHGDRPYFLGWRDNDLRGDRVSPENLAKTERCYGPAIRTLCERTNQSSRWTHIATSERPFFAPPAKRYKQQGPRCGPLTCPH